MAGLNGLASRDPLLAASMFVFMLSLAGVPPFSGFLSKLLMLNGIVTVSAGTGGAESLLSWATSVDPAFWLAVAIVLNSALSIFYYLRMGMVMFFEPNEGGRGPRATPSYARSSSPSPSSRWPSALAPPASGCWAGRGRSSGPPGLSGRLNFT